MSKYKKDLALKRQIKEMEDKLRNENAAQVQPAAEDSKISFDQWWIIINGKVSMRSHLKEILLADFKARGLSKREDEAAYDNALKLFGIKW